MIPFFFASSPVTPLVLSPQMPIFFGPSLTEDEKVYEAQDRNAMWPFEEADDGSLVYRIRYTRFFVSIAGAALCLAVVALFAAMDWVESGIFLWFVVGLVLFLHSAFVYRRPRSYVVWPALRRYAYLLGSEVVHSGGLHNFYVRLRKRHGEEERYFITLSGYQVDKQIISGASTDLRAMRAAAQSVAESVGVNYFDLENLSHHHRIVHPRPTTFGVSSKQ